VEITFELGSFFEKISSECVDQVVRLEIPVIQVGIDRDMVEERSRAVIDDICFDCLEEWLVLINFLFNLAKLAMLVEKYMFFFQVGWREKHKETVDGMIWKNG
jgi:hypothetical protein